MYEKEPTLSCSVSEVMIGPCWRPGNIPALALCCEKENGKHSVDLNDSSSSLL